MSLAFEVVIFASNCSEVTLGLVAPDPSVEGEPCSEQSVAQRAESHSCTLQENSLVAAPGVLVQSVLPSRDTSCSCGMQVWRVLLRQPKGTHPKATPTVAGDGGSPSYLLCWAAPARRPGPTSVPQQTLNSWRAGRHPGSSPLSEGLETHTCRGGRREGTGPP